MTTFPEAKFFPVNGLNMAVYEQGEGVPVVMCHGFPELAYAWRHQIPAIADAGFHAIAPDQRGYGKTGGPKGPDAVPLYDMEHLTGDMVALLDAMGIEKAIFCGHDWGGMVVWQMPLRHPDRVAGVIGVNTPFIPRGEIDPIEGMRAMFGEQMYIVFFQNYGVADKILDGDVAKTMRFFYRKGGMTLKEFDALPAEFKNLALIEALQTPEEMWAGEPLHTPEEHAFFVDAFEKTGFEGGINWYRNFTRNWETSADLVEKVDVPCLMISAENDVALRPEMADGMEAFVPDLEKHLIKDCGHWTQSEKPDELNRLITDWLKRRFG